MKSFVFTFLMCTLVTFSFAQTVAETFAEAEAALEKEDYKTALKKMKYVVKNDVPKEEYVFVKATAELFLGKYQEAVNTYTQGIYDLPKSAELYSGRGTLLYQLQSFENSIKDYTSAIELEELDSTKANYYSNRSTSKMGMRDFQGAYDDLTLAYELDSTNLGILANFGVVCDEIGKPDETLKWLLKAIEIDPDYYPAYANIGFKYQAMGEHEKAIENYNKVLELQPNEPLGYSNRAYSRMKLGDLKGAMTDINKSLELYPGNSYAYRNRALIYIEMGKTKKACKDLQAAIDQGFTKMYGDEVKKLQDEHCN